MNTEQTPEQISNAAFDACTHADAMRGTCYPIAKQIEFYEIGLSLHVVALTAGVPRYKSGHEYAIKCTKVKIIALQARAAGDHAKANRIDRSEERAAQIGL